MLCQIINSIYQFIFEYRKKNFLRIMGNLLQPDKLLLAECILELKVSGRKCVSVRVCETAVGSWYANGRCAVAWPVSLRTRVSYNADSQRNGFLSEASAFSFSYLTKSIVQKVNEMWVNVLNRLYFGGVESLI